MKNFVLWLLCLLVGGNIALTLKINAQLSGKSSGQIESEQVNPLPDFVTRGLRVQLADQLLEAYNSNDLAALWNFLGEYAQAQLTKEQLSDSVDRVTDLIGPIVSAKYLYHEAGGKVGNLTFYTLYYQVQLTDQCKVSDTGTLKLSIATSGTDLQVVGFFITSNIKQ